MTDDLLWTPRAEEDLLEIHSFIELDNPGAADRMIDRLRNSAE